MLQTCRSEELKSDLLIFIIVVIVLYEMHISVIVIIDRIRISRYSMCNNLCDTQCDKTEIVYNIFN